MITGLNVLVLFPQFDGPLGIALQVHIGWISIQTSEGKHFVHHLKDQDILSKGKTFGDSRFGQAVFAYFFDVHGII